MAANGSWAASGSSMKLCPALFLANCTHADTDVYPTMLKVVHLLVLTALMLFTTVGNGLMIVVLSTRRQLKSVTNMFVISLSVSDLLVGLLVIPINFVVPTSVFYGYTTCIYCGSTTLTLCLASITNIFAVTIDRYIAIVDPLKYPVRMTRRRAAGAIAFVWTYAAVLGVLPALGWRARESRCTRGETYSSYYVLVVVWSGFIVPLWGTVALYWRILSEARRHARLHRGVCMSSFCMERHKCCEHHGHRRGRGCECGGGSDRDAEKTDDSPKQLKVRPLVKLVRPLSIRRNGSGAETVVSRKRKFVTVAIMLVYFELSWLPVFVSMLIDVFINPRWLPAWVHRVIGLLAFVNCAMDPIIYGYRNNDIRQAVVNMVKAVCRRNTNRDKYLDIQVNHPIPRNASRVRFVE
ncbi:hypothetical protein NP493_1g02001 [Ridgeia piscesae]|uniref:G-protein coupled receptors family 1 profile domain-containing protein n=1 Tax=Ridgeia piscesae TaxID=27915 RepID=A0AAD9PGH4_RIDPI|nr:hypothetical protein NP493_1g02001 [Ridgeia piscesae]